MLSHIADHSPLPLAMKILTKQKRPLVAVTIAITISIVVPALLFTSTMSLRQMVSLPSMTNIELNSTIDSNDPRGLARLAIGCPKPPAQRQSPPLFAVTYPGPDTDRIWALIDALTGSHIVDGRSNSATVRDSATVDISADSKDDGTVPAKEKTMLTVVTPTCYPHELFLRDSSSSVDPKISRAFILLENPITAIPKFYKMGNMGIPNNQKSRNSKGTLLHPLERWMKWREKHAEWEIVEFQRLICYWLDRITPQNRLILTLEGLTNDQKGPFETFALGNFLFRDVNSQSVGCIWRAVVKEIPPRRRATSTYSSDIIRNRSLEIFDSDAPANTNFQHEQQNKDPDESEILYVFTPQQLEKMMSMLLELAERYEEEERVHTIMMEYYKEVRSARHQLGPLTSAIDESPPTKDWGLSVGENNLKMSESDIQPFQICGRLAPIPLSVELETSQYYSSLCFAGTSTSLLLISGYERYGRTGNNLIEFLHALQYVKERNMMLGIMFDGWVTALLTKYWMAFPTTDIYNGNYMSEGIHEWKRHVERAFCIKVFMSEDELAGYNVHFVETRDLFMFRYKTSPEEYIQYQLHILRMLFRSQNHGVGRDIKNRPVGDMCSVIDGIFGGERQSVIYSVIHSRSLEGEPGFRLLARIAELSGIDPVAALNMEPGYIKAILSPLGLLKHPILFISDDQRPEILEKLLADPDIGHQIRLIPTHLSWVGGDMTIAIMANAFIGNPASTFSGFIAKSRIALGFDNNFLFRVKNETTGVWMDACEDKCIFDKRIMRSMS